MDINQLKYFMTIVENDCNMTMAAEKLHISQPALSKIITKFEKDENLLLFNRLNGRLNGLTGAGEHLYSNARSLVGSFDKMMQEIREHSRSIQGTVRIGIPPLILTVLFTEIMAALISENPTIRFEIVEVGAFELKKQLLMNEVDFAILISPTGLSPLIYHEKILYEDQLTAFMSGSNNLAVKPKLRWTDLKNKPLALFNETFMIHHQVKRKFNSLKIAPNVTLTSGSWDFLVEVTRNTDLVTILPSPINRHISFQDIHEVPFDQPIKWQVVLNYPVKNFYTQVERYTIDSLVGFFSEDRPIQPVNQ